MRKYLKIFGKYEAVGSETKKEWVLLKTWVSTRSCICQSLVKQVSSCKLLATALEVGALRCKVGALLSSLQLGPCGSKKQMTPRVIFLIASVPQPWKREATVLWELESGLPVVETSTSFVDTRGHVSAVGLLDCGSVHWVSVPAVTKSQICSALSVFPLNF